LCSVTLLSGACTLILVHCVQPCCEISIFFIFLFVGVGKVL
jgi:hypothetical protein